MTKNFLEEIIAYKKSLIAQKRFFLDNLKTKIQKGRHTRYRVFQKAISQPGQLNLIAEIKKASPSQGVIRSAFSLLDLANVYAKAGAAAISVLTEDKYFLGKPPYVRDVSDHVGLPVLTKDFIISDEQIYETFAFGSSAVLLIVAILDNKELKSLIAVADTLDMDCLVEIHNEEELKRAVDCGAQIIGVNNRNLKTLEVDLKTSEKLIPRIPKGRIIVSESGIKDKADVDMVKDLGAHAVLIGETFLRASDVGAKVREVMYGEN
ncbi:MAG: indole-3-glycerol phosphate synthase TrpC [Candidatus Omnitrophota bacterium]